MLIKIDKNTTRDSEMHLRSSLTPTKRFWFAYNDTSDSARPGMRGTRAEAKRLQSAPPSLPPVRRKVKLKISMRRLSKKSDTTAEGR